MVKKILRKFIVINNGVQKLVMMVVKRVDTVQLMRCA